MCGVCEFERLFQENQRPRIGALTQISSKNTTLPRNSFWTASGAKSDARRNFWDSLRFHTSSCEISEHTMVYRM